MKRRMKKLSAMLLCVAMGTALLSGCGGAPKEEGSAAPDETKTEGTAAGEDDSQEAKAEEGSGDVQTVRILTQFGEASKKAGLEAISAAVEAEHPEYKFEITCLSYDKYVERLKQEIASGDPPTIFTGRSWEFPEFIDAGKVVELTDQEWMKTFDENNLAEAERNGKMWAMPYDKNVVTSFYRADVLKEQNLEVPTTKEEWIKVCEALKAEGITPVAFGGAETDPCDMVLQVFIDGVWNKTGNTDSAKKIMEGESILAFPEWKEAYMNAYDMMIPYIEKNDMSITRDVAYEQFCAGDRPFTFQGNFALGMWREMAPEAEIGAMPIVWSNGAADNKIRFASDDSLMLAADGNVDAGLAWMEYAASVDGLSLWADATKCFSSSTLVDQVKDPDPVNQTFVQALESGNCYYKGDAEYLSGNYASELQNMSQKFFADGIEAYAEGKSAEEFVDSFLEEVDQRFKALQ